MSKEYFGEKKEVNPIIYAYELPEVNKNKNLFKIGYTTRTAEQRIKEQTKTAGVKYKIVLEESAMKNDGSVFSDRDIHNILKKKGIKNPEGEWFECTIKDISKAIYELRTGIKVEDNRILDFKMRPEQEDAVNKTMDYFKRSKKENKNKKPHFLWNAKMRFGKTFASYQLAKKMGWNKILVLTFKPAVESAWDEDLQTHVDFKNWQFISRNSENTDKVDFKKPIVYFGSFQDHLGKTKDNKIKDKNKWVHDTKWDCIIFDEYHFGAWRENAKDLFGKDIDADKEIEQYKKIEQEGLDLDETIYDLEEELKIQADHFLYLSGTPFRAINSGEFIEEQIYSWTYSDEQKAKAEWKGDKNPYLSLPRMIMLTYQLPDDVRNIAMQGEYNEFDLNVFFSATGTGKDAKFKYAEEVQKWLNFIRGNYIENAVNDLKMGTKKPPLPYSHVNLVSKLNHTLWFLPSVASCHAMNNLLKMKQNNFYKDYKVVVAAGTEAGIGIAALDPVKKAMGDDPLKSKSITLSCGKLTTGVTVKPWTGIFMLRNSSSPETYFQAAFRVQSPWSIKNPDDKSPNKELVIKEDCYVFDFAPDRALRQIAEYSTRIDIHDNNPEAKVADFINFLPILAYDGSSMKEIDAAGVLEIAMSGTTATLLARRWQSALLVNVDNITLSKLLNNQEALDALMQIEGFRNLSQDIETIINKSDAVKKAKRDGVDKDNKKAKDELTEAEKEYKSKRKMIQEKLMKFATRIPVFMYLTDYRERTLKDIITKLEPKLFKKVTGLTVKDFELLEKLGLFNSSLMNDAVFKFKKYEDSSLSYLGIIKHDPKNIGLFDTTIENKKTREFVNVPIK